MQQPVIVAEVDGEGEVDTVWLWSRGMRFPKPVSKPSEITALMARSEISGASRSAVRRWHKRALAAATVS